MEFAEHNWSHFLRLLGFGLLVLSPFVISLGVSNIAFSYQSTCDELNDCGTTSGGYAYTWASVPLWAPIPIFVNGVVAVWISTQRISNISIFAGFSFINTVVFASLIVIITALELTNKFSGGLSLSPSLNDTPMYLFEVLICVAGGLLFLITGVLSLATNCLPFAFTRFKPQTPPVGQTVPNALAMRAQPPYEVDRAVGTEWKNSYVDEGVVAAGAAAAEGNMVGGNARAAVFFADANYKRQILGGGPMVASRW